MTTNDIDIDAIATRTAFRLRLDLLLREAEQGVLTRGAIREECRRIDQRFGTDLTDRLRIEPQQIGHIVSFPVRVRIFPGFQ